MKTVTNKLALACGPHHTPPNAYLHAHPGGHMPKLPPLLPQGCAARAWAVDVGRAGVQKGVTEELGHFRGARMENPDNPAQSSCLRLRVAPTPLCAHSLLCSSTHSLTIHRHPEMPPWSSHYIANMQSFLWLKKKKVTISRNNVHKLECKQMHFFKCLFFWKVSLELQMAIYLGRWGTVE